MDRSHSNPANAPPRTSSHCLTNPKTQHKYLLQISRPLNLKKSLEKRGKRLPVIYILDGNAFFLTASDICWRREMSPNWAGGGIVVAIGYALSLDDSRLLSLIMLAMYRYQHDPDETCSMYNFEGRNRDYTPCDAEGIPGEGEISGYALGGADSFLEFVEAEVRPFVRSLSREEGIEVGKEAFWGHSFGGLCVLHSLMTGKGGNFPCYYAVSPSIWWGKGYILKEEERLSEIPNTQLTMSYGSKELPENLDRGSEESSKDFGSKTSAAQDEDHEKRLRVAKDRAMGPNVETLQQRLIHVPPGGRAKLPGVRVIRIEGDDHGTVSTVGLLRALTEFFSMDS